MVQAGTSNYVDARPKKNTMRIKICESLEMLQLQADVLACKAYQSVAGCDVPIEGLSQEVRKGLQPGKVSS